MALPGQDYDTLTSTIEARLPDNDSRDIDAFASRQSFLDTIDSLWRIWQASTAYLAGETVWHPTERKLISKIEDGNSAPIFDPALWQDFEPGDGGAQSLFVFATIADMVAATDLEDKTEATVLGYNSEGDTDPWKLTYHSTGRTTVTIDGGFYHLGSGADDYWEAHEKTVAHVDRFGAVGDGVADDKDTIQKAIDSLSTIADKVEFGNKKTYSIGSAPGLQIPSDLSHFDIEGNKATIKYADDVSPSGSTYILYFLRNRFFSVRNLTLDGNRANRPVVAAGPLLNCFGAQHFELTHVIAKDGPFDGFYFGGAGDTTTTDEWFSKKGWLAHCICDNNGRNGMSLVAAQEIHSFQCEFTRTNGVSPHFGVDQEPNPGDLPQATRNNTFTECLFADNVGSGLGIILVSQSRDCHVIRCHFEGNGEHGINGSWFVAQDCTFLGDYQTVKMQNFGKVIRCRFEGVNLSSSTAPRTPVIDCGTTDPYDDSIFSLVEGCEFVNCGGPDMDIIGRQSGISHVIVKYNQTDVLTGRFITAAGVGGSRKSRWTIENNTVETTADIAMVVSELTRGSSVLSNTVKAPKEFVRASGYDMLITGNTFIRTNAAQELAGCIVANFAGRQVNVSGNTFAQENSSQSCIYETNGGKITASGNTYTNFSLNAANFVVSNGVNLVCTDYTGWDSPAAQNLTMGAGSTYWALPAGNWWKKTDNSGSDGWVAV